MAHDFSFVACQHNLHPRHISFSNTMSKKALLCQIVNTFMPKKVFLVFLQTDVKYFNILLTQESSNRATDISKLTSKQCQGLNYS